MGRGLRPPNSPFVLIANAYLKFCFFSSNEAFSFYFTFVFYYWIFDSKKFPPTRHTIISAFNTFVPPPCLLGMAPPLMSYLYLLDMCYILLILLMYREVSYVQWRARGGCLPPAPRKEKRKGKTGERASEREQRRKKEENKKREKGREKENKKAENR